MYVDRGRQGSRRRPSCIKSVCRLTAFRRSSGPAWAGDAGSYPPHDVKDNKAPPRGPAPDDATRRGTRRCPPKPAGCTCDIPITGPEMAIAALLDQNINRRRQHAALRARCDRGNPAWRRKCAAEPHRTVALTSITDLAFASIGTKVPARALFAFISHTIDDPQV